MNLIITCARNLETETREEVKNLLEKLGDSEPTINITKMPGILTVITNLDPVEAVRNIHETLLDEPWSIRYCLRLIPIQKTTSTDIKMIEEELEKIVHKIEENESYRISIEKRNSNISGTEIISRIAKKIKNKVSLEKPDKVILIEILGNITGLSILRKSDVLSIEKAKRKMSEQD